jgi:uncharacterized protein (DUF433 family)
MAACHVRIAPGGRVVIPAEFRKTLGVDVGDSVVIELATGSCAWAPSFVASPGGEGSALAVIRGIIVFGPLLSRQAAMVDETLLSRITADPLIFGGKPIVRGMRISVELILSLLAQGETVEAILDDYPELEADDVRACLAYAHAAISDESIEAVRVTPA